MEAAAIFHGGEFTDHPPSASPVIAQFARVWNDDLETDDRNALMPPFVPYLCGTRGTDEAEHTRAAVALDWLVRTQAPVWLIASGLLRHADELSALPEVRTTARPTERVSHALYSAGLAASHLLETSRAAMARSRDTHKRYHVARQRWAQASAAIGAAAGSAAHSAVLAHTGPDVSWGIAAQAWDVCVSAAKAALMAGEHSEAVVMDAKGELQSSAARLLWRMIEVGSAPE